MAEHHPRTMNSSTWNHVPSLISSFDLGGRGSPSKSLYRTSRSGTNNGPGVISKPNTPSPSHSPGPGSPLYHHHPSHNNISYMHAIQQHPSQQYKAPGSRNGVQYNLAQELYSQGNGGANGPAGWGAADQRQNSCINNYKRQNSRDSPIPLTTSVAYLQFRPEVKRKRSAIRHRRPKVLSMECTGKMAPHYKQKIWPWRVGPDRAISLWRSRRGRLSISVGPGFVT